MAKGTVEKRVYKPSRTGDFVLTFIYFLEVALILYAFSIRADNWEDLISFVTFSILTYLAIKFINWFCKTVMYNYVSGHLLRNAPYNHPLVKEKTMAKFVGVTWQLAIHLTMSCWEVYLLWTEPWMSHTHTCFEPNPTDYVAPFSLRVFFIAQIAIWVLTCFSHRFNSDAHAHKDYFVMYIHHLATIGLVLLAYWDNYARIGLVVLLVHDVSDIGIDLLKTCNYLHLEGPSSFFLIEGVYAITISFWIYFRLYLFPVEIIYNSTYFAMNFDGYLTSWGTRSVLQVILDKYGADSAELAHFFKSGLIANALLITLFVLHIWWFILLLRIIIRFISSSEKAHDVGASEYEGASDDEHED